MRIKSGHDVWARMSAQFTLRPYHTDDEDAAIALWQVTWQQAYPEIDFAARVPWWRERWRWKGEQSALPLKHDRQVHAAGDGPGLV